MDERPQWDELTTLVYHALCFYWCGVSGKASEMAQKGTTDSNGRPYTIEQVNAALDISKNALAAIKQMEAGRIVIGRVQAEESK